MENSLLTTLDQITWKTLREEGLKHLQSMVGHLWTDYNIHDPGVTIFEVLCYAISDLDSRLSLNIADILADDTALADGPAEKQFFSPGEILTVNPVTMNDYRKLLIDIPGVKNAWMSPAIDSDPTLYYDKDNNALLYNYAPGSQRIALNGLYRVYIEKDEDVKDDNELKTRVAEKLHAHRNLCEDFTEIHLMEQETIAIFSDIQIAENADPDKVMAGIYLDLKDFISPRVKQYSLKRMFQKGKSMEQIFNGPQLENGFIDDDELGTGEKRKELHTSDLIRIIMAHPEVKDVRNLFISNVSNPETTDKKEWALMVDDTKALLLEPLNNTKIRLFNNDTMCPVNINIALAEMKVLQEQSEREIFDDPAMDLEEPSGNATNLLDFEPLADKFPPAYGIGETGLPSMASAKRRVQARQLKAYLLFFEQILVNYLRQLDSFKRLFALRQNHVFYPVQREFTRKINSILSRSMGWHQPVTGEDFTSISGVSEALAQTIWTRLKETGLIDDEGNVLRILPDDAADLVMPVIEAAIINAMHDVQRISPYSFTGISGVNHALSNEIWDHLKNKGFIDDGGAVSPTFTPDQNGFTLDLNSADYPKTYFSQLPPAAAWQEDFAGIPAGYQYVETGSGEGIPDRASAFQRKNRILNHLLAQFNEKFADYALFGFANSDYLNAKAGFLKNYPELSRNRNRAYNILTQIPDPQVFQYTDGLKELIAAKLGLEVRAPETAGSNQPDNFFIVEHILSRPDGILPLDFICCEKINEVYQPDPYSYQLTFVIPRKTGRFGNNKFKDLVYATIANETPAHVSYTILEFDSGPMNEFATAYRNFLWELKERRLGHPNQYNFYRNQIMELLGIGRIKLPVLHLDAHQVNGDEINPGNASPITEWKDLSRNNHHATTGLTVQPEYIKTGTGGSPWVKFSTNTRLTIDDSLIQDDFGIVVVYKALAASGLEGEYIPLVAGDTANFRLGFYGNGTVAAEMNNITVPANLTMNLESTIGVPHLAILTREKATGEMKLSVDGVLQTSQILQKDVNLSLAHDSIFIGPGEGACGDYELGEVIILDSVLAGGRKQELEEYLSAKWNISLSAAESVAGVALHLDASETSSVTYDGKTTLISDWNDLGPGGILSSLSSASMRPPEYVMEGIAGLPAIQFNDSSFFVPDSENVLRGFTKNTEDFIIPVIETAVINVLRKENRVSRSSFRVISGVNNTLSHKIWVFLKNSGYIDGNGNVLPAFTPDENGFTINLDGAVLNPIQAEFERKISSILSEFKDSLKPVPQDRFATIGGVNQALSLVLWLHLKEKGFIKDTGDVLKVFAKNVEDFINPIIEKAIINRALKENRISRDAFTGISGINNNLSNKIWTHFFNQKYIDGDGNILPAFTPGSAGFTLGLDISILNPVQAEWERKISAILSLGIDSGKAVLEDAFTGIGGVNQALSQTIWACLKEKAVICADDTCLNKFFNGDFTVAVVYKAYAGESMLFERVADDGSELKSISVALDTKGDIVVHGGAGELKLPGTLQDTHMAIISGKNSGDKLEMRLCLDGKALITEILQDIQAFGNCPGALFFGRSNSGRRSFSGEIAEIVFYKEALPAWGRQRLEQYLAEKWKIDISGVDEIAAPVLHLDAARLATVLDENNVAIIDRDIKVSKWIDLSYHGNDAIQSNNSRKPLYTTDGIHGLGSIEFAQEKIGEDIYEDSLTTEQVIPGDFTIMMAFKPDTIYYSTHTSDLIPVTESTGWTQGVALLDADCSGLFNDFGLSFGEHNQQMIVMGGIGDRLAGDHTIKTRELEFDKTHLITFTRLKITGEVKLFADGLLHAQVDLRDDVILNDSRAIKIGAFNSEGIPFHGMIGEVIIFDTVLSDEKRQRIEKYLATKWNIALTTLPIDVAGLCLHLDAANFENVITTPDHKVSRWLYHNAMNEIAAIQDDIESRPIYDEFTMNGMPGIGFYNNLMNITLHSTATDYDDFTVAVVYKPRSGGNISPGWGYGAGLIDNYDEGTVNHFGIAVSKNNELMARVGTQSIKTPVLLNCPHIAVITRKKDTGDVNMYVDGLLISNGQVSEGISMKISQLTLGAIRIQESGQTVSKGYYQGDIAEVVFFKKVFTMEDRQMLENYLSLKWKIDISGINHIIKPVLHLDAGQITTLIKSQGQKISQWLDVNGHKNHAAQITPAKQPVYRENAYHGLGAVHFDGANQHCLSLKPAVKDDFTIILVYNADSRMNFTQFMPVAQDSFTVIAGIDTTLSGEIWTHLWNKGYIDDNGNVLAAFTPGQSGFSLNLTPELRRKAGEKIETKIAEILDGCTTLMKPVAVDAFTDIGGFDPTLSQTVWADLQEAGYINNSGYVIKHFEPNVESFITPVTESAIINVLLAENWVAGAGLFDGNCAGTRAQKNRRDFGILIGKTGNQGTFMAGIGVPDEKDYQIEAVAPFDAPHIGVLTRKKDTGMVKLYVDKAKPQQARIAMNVTLMDSDQFTIGAVNTGGNYFTGDIAEIIVLDQVLPDEKITEIRDYLAKKWDINIQ
jgi:hypothetical protein